MIQATDNRPRHRVSVKIALLNGDKTKVLITHVAGGDYHGLPGGHVEYGETPDDAILREIQEELGVSYDGPIEQAGFWRENNGDRIILAYQGLLDENTDFRVDMDEVSGVEWLTKDDIKQGKFRSRVYLGFVSGLLDINSQ